MATVGNHVESRRIEGMTRGNQGSIGLGFCPLLENPLSGRISDSKHMPRNSAKPLCLWLLFTVSLLYHAMAVNPFISMEGDGDGLAGDAIQLARNPDAPHPFYRYNVQPGTVCSASLLYRFLGVEPLPTLSILTGLGSLLFLLLSALLLSRLVPLSFPVCGMVLLLFPETSVSAYYINSCAIAAPLAIGGILLLYFKQNAIALLGAGVLWAVAAWMRCDAILIAPAGLVFLSPFRWRDIYRKLGLLLFSACLTYTVLCHLSGSDFIEMLKEVSGHLRYRASGLPDLGVPFLDRLGIKTHLAFFPFLLVFLIPLGARELIQQKRWKLLGFMGLGLLPLYFVYLGHATTPKYFHYLVPFFALPILFCLSQVKYLSKSHRTTFLFVASSLFLLQYPLGFVKHRTEPGISAVVGPGTTLRTDDGIRLSSGLLYSPLVWHQKKSLKRLDIQEFRDALSALQEDTVTLYVTPYDCIRFLLYELLRAGYTLESSQEVPLSRSEGYLWRYGQHTKEKTVLVLYTTHPALDSEEIRENLRRYGDGTFLLLLTHTADALVEGFPSHQTICGTRQDPALVAYKITLEDKHVPSKDAESQWESLLCPSPRFAASLDRLTALRYERPSGPKRLLLSFRPTDPGNFVLSMPLTFSTLLEPYVPVQRVHEAYPGHGVLMRRRYEVEPMPHLKLPSTEGAMGEWTQVPFCENFLFVQIDLALTRTYRLIHFWQERRPLELDVFFRSGKLRSFEVTPEMCQNGFLINYLPLDDETLSALFSSAQDDFVTGFRLKGPGVSRFKRTITLNWREYRSSLSFQPQKPYDFANLPIRTERALFAVDFVEILGKRYDPNEGPILVDTGIASVVQLYGWAVDPVAKNPVGDVVAVTKQGMRVHATCGLIREDVASHFQLPRCRTAGFHIAFPLDLLHKGKETVSFQVIPEDTLRKYPTPVEIQFLVK